MNKKVDNVILNYIDKHHIAYFKDSNVFILYPGRDDDDNDYYTSTIIHNDLLSNVLSAELGHIFGIENFIYIYRLLISKYGCSTMDLATLFLGRAKLPIDSVDEFSDRFYDFMDVNLRFTGKHHGDMLFYIKGGVENLYHILKDY